MTVDTARSDAPPAARGVFARAEEGLRRLVLRLAWPVAAERLALGVLAAVDAALVGRYVGADAVAAVGLGGLLLWLPLVGAFGAEVGATALVARATGRAMPADADRAIHAAISVAFVWGLLSALALALGGRAALAMLGGEGDVPALGMEFLLPACLALPPLLVAYAASGALRGAGDTVRPMLILFAANVVNFAVTFVLISGVAGARLGVVASGIGYAAAGVTAGALALALVLRGAGGLRYRPLHLGLLPARADLVRFLRIAAPVTLEELQFIVAFLIYTRIVARSGSAALAAHAVAMRSLEVAIVPGFALGTAATTLVGQALGMERPDLAVRSARAARGVSLAVLIGMGVALAAAAPWLPRLFLDDGAAARTATRLLWVFALALPGIGVAAVLSGALRGAGDVRFVLVAALACTWLVRLPVAFAGAVVLGWGAPGAWLGAVAENNLRALLVSLRFASGRWIRAGR